jgi:hypothetical protein
LPVVKPVALGLIVPSDTNKTNPIWWYLPNTDRLQQVEDYFKLNILTCKLTKEMIGHRVQMFMMIS